MAYEINDISKATEIVHGLQAKYKLMEGFQKTGFKYGFPKRWFNEESYKWKQFVV